MNNIAAISNDEIAEVAEKYNVPLADNYKLDTAYVSYLYTFDTLKYSLQIKNHLQPSQALYYDQNGNLSSFQINCYAGGFPNLKWDRNEIMTTFPPKEQAPIDSILPLDKHLEFVQNLPQSEKISLDRYDYIVLVHWNKFMGRQSKNLIKTVQENAELKGKHKVKIIYVNTDEVFALFE